MLKHHTAWNGSISPNSHVRSRDGLATTTSHRWVIWLVSIGIFLPYTFGESGKYVIALFLLPALLVFIGLLSQGKRHLTACDISVLVAALWMVAVKIGGSGSASDSLFAAGSDALAFVGSYTVARSFFYGGPSVTEFVRALKFVAIILLALAVLDTLSGTFFTKNIVATFFHDPRPPRGGENAEIHRSLFGFVVIRASSAFDHPILYGTFCSVAAAVFLYTERAWQWGFFYYGVCLIGCLLSVSSAPFLGFAIILSVYSYDKLLHSFSQRWKLLCLIAVAIICAFFVFSNNPISWPIRHLTLDPTSGFYRLLIWQNAFNYIARFPITGVNAGSWLTNDILSNSIDCVWLVLSLSYGLPMVASLLLANLLACGAFGRRIKRRPIDHKILQMRTAFSLVLFLFAFLGLTVHFWGAIWLFWGLCIGIRTSLEEYCAIGSAPSSSPTKLRPTFAGVR